MSYLPFSRRLAGCLAAGAGLSPEKETILAYVIEILVLNLLNVILALALGLLLGVLPGTAACLFTAAIFRHTAGGAHSSSPWRCGVLTVAVFPLLALLSGYLAAFEPPFPGMVSVVAVLAGATAIILLAPVDSPAAPVIAPARRKKLKLLSLLVLLLLAVGLAVLQQNPSSLAREIQVCIAATVIWISFMLTKPGHALIFFMDRVKIKK